MVAEGSYGAKFRKSGVVEEEWCGFNKKGLGNVVHLLKSHSYNTDDWR